MKNYLHFEFLEIAITLAVFGLFAVFGAFTYQQAFFIVLFTIAIKSIKKLLFTIIQKK